MELKDLLKLEYSVFDVRLFNLAGTAITVGTLVIFVVIVLVSYLLSMTLQRALRKALTMRGKAADGTVGALSRLLHYLVVAVGLGVGLQTIGINLGALFAAGAVFAIGIGLAMQSLAQNFVSGVILLVERAIKPGDVLQVDGRVVRVERMGIRATFARTLDDEEIIVPNSNIVQSVVTNYTLQDSYYRLRAVVGVHYSSDMKKVDRVLKDAARGIQWKSKDREPVILLVEFGSSSVDWEVSVWIDDPWKMRKRRSELNQTIWWALMDAGVTIAFPQVDVHLDPPVMESLRAAAG